MNNKEKKAKLLEKEKEDSVANLPLNPPPKGESGQCLFQWVYLFQRVRRDAAGR